MDQILIGAYQSWRRWVLGTQMKIMKWSYLKDRYSSSNNKYFLINCIPAGTNGIGIVISWLMILSLIQRNLSVNI